MNRAAIRTGCFLILWSVLGSTSGIAVEPGDPDHAEGEPEPHRNQGNSASHQAGGTYESHSALRGHASHGGGVPITADCAENEVREYSMGICSPIAQIPRSHRQIMLHGNAFLVGVTEEGLRGRAALVSPNHFMLDIGKSLHERHYFNVNLMATLERWTIPSQGYPLLLQTGETDLQGHPFIDAQHPHSSPIMGLTFSDTFALGSEKDGLRFFFAPRGQSTEGPIAFMHRPMGEVNPDAPLGHHIGQDAGHISSTVIGTSVRQGHWIFEGSAFNGTEPEPLKVDLPLGVPNSGAFRVIRELPPEWTVMASFAYVKSPEHHQTDIPHYLRYSASVYTTARLWDVSFQNSFIGGAITNYSHASALFSIGEEIVLSEAPRLWARIEALQRTPGELDILNTPDIYRGRWVGAVTVGYFYKIPSTSWLETGMGVSGTMNLLPEEYIGAYGGNPLTGKVYLKIGGGGAL